MELFTYGETPYPAMKNWEVNSRVPEGYRMPKPVEPNVPDDVYDVMLKCWDKTPDNRPTFDFLSHYFRNYEVTSGDRCNYAHYGR